MVGINLVLRDDSSTNLLDEIIVLNKINTYNDTSSEIEKVSKLLLEVVLEQGTFLDNAVDKYSSLDDYFRDSKSYFERSEEVSVNLNSLLKKQSSIFDDLLAYCVDHIDNCAVQDSLFAFYEFFFGLHKSNSISQVRSYEVLGINPPFSKKKLSNAYRKIAMSCHPDQNNGGTQEKTKEFIEATDAYKLLLSII